MRQTHWDNRNKIMYAFIQQGLLDTICKVLVNKYQINVIDKHFKKFRRIIIINMRLFSIRAIGKVSQRN